MGPFPPQQRNNVAQPLKPPPRNPSPCFQTVHPLQKVLEYSGKRHMPRHYASKYIPPLAPTIVGYLGNTDCAARSAVAVLRHEQSWACSALV